MPSIASSASRSLGVCSGIEELAEALGVAGVQYVVRLGPAPPSHVDAVAQEFEVTRAVGVCVMAIVAPASTACLTASREVRS